MKQLIKQTEISVSFQIVPRKLSRKMSALTTLLFSWLFLGVICADLTSYLSVPKQDKIRGIEDLATLGYQFYVYGGSNIQASLEEAPEGSTRNKIWENQVMTKVQ